MAEPVHGLERVAVAHGVRLQTRRAQQVHDLAALVDPDVAADVRAVVLAQRPEDLLGVLVGDADGEDAAGLEHARQFAGEDGVVVDVLQRLGADDAVEGAVLEGEALAGGLHPVDAGADLVAAAHDLEQVAAGADVLARHVGADDVGLDLAQLEDVPPGAAAEVDDAVVRGRCRGGGGRWTGICRGWRPWLGAW